MMQFDYKALDRNGQKVSGVLEATGSQAVIYQLERQGLTPLNVQAIRSKGTRRMGRKPGDKERLLFLDQLVTMLTAGVSLHASLSALSRTAGNAYLANEVAGLVKHLDQGDSFSDALAASQLGFPSFVVQLIRSGEATGQLREALSGAAEQMRYDLRVKKEFSQALTYPVILVISGIVAIGIIFMMVVPKFANLLDKVDDLPLLAELVLSGGVFFNEWKWFIASGLLAVILLLFVLGSLPVFRKMLVEFVLYIPGVGSLLKMNMMARWTGMLGILLSNRVPVLDALGLSGRSVEVASLQNRMNLVRDKVREGAPLTEAVQETHLLSAVALDLIGVGERSGKLPEMLSSVSQLYAEEMRDRVQRLLSLIEPLSIFVIGSVVGLIMTGVILAITSLNQAVV